MSRYTGERVMLREVRQEDISGMRAWATDEAACESLGTFYVSPQTWEMTERSLSLFLNGDASGANFVIAERETGRYLGQISVNMIDRIALHGELSIVMTPDSRGKGYAREGVSRMLKHAFDAMNLNRVHLKVYEDNPAAIACYTACGFVREGVLRQHAYHRGRYIDVICMGVLRDDWRQTH